MLFLAELLWVPLAQSTDDGERGQLRLRSKPALDRGDMRVEHRRHADPLLVAPLGPPVCRALLARLDRFAERLRKGRCIRCR
jgi:hypothetical protein